ncbi:unnamed protein product, partial [Polarella glacialis]
RMTAAVAQPASALHLPRNRDGPDTRLLNRASRLSAVATAVGAIDLKQVAATYQQEAGCSGLEAATVAAAAVGAALK